MVNKKLNPQKVAFISCVSDEEWYSESLLYQKQLKIPEGMSAEFIPVVGAPSMCAGYNTGMAKSDAKYKIYLHQDVLTVNKNLIEDILRIFRDESIGLIGVIGARSLPATGVWWDSLRVVGRVLHACEPESIMESVNQDEEKRLSEVEAVDGLLMMTQYDIPWREDIFTDWHLYDTSQCKEFARAGLRTVVPYQEEFWAIHCPKEKQLAPNYRREQRAFLREYGDELWGTDF